jgi:hypothetical protein
MCDVSRRENAAAHCSFDRFSQKLNTESAAGLESRLAARASRGCEQVIALADLVAADRVTQ